jgi:hypothetical protein
VECVGLDEICAHGSGRDISSVNNSMPPETERNAKCEMRLASRHHANASNYFCIALLERCFSG